MGKSTFEAQRANAFRMRPEDLVIVGLDVPCTPDHDLYDPRVHRPLDDRFVKNIKRRGVRVPVLVRKDGDKAQVVDGKTRVRAARLANEEFRAAGEEELTVLVIVERDNDIAGVLILTNEQRRDDDVLEKSEKLLNYLSRGRSDEQAAEVFGVELQTINMWKRLADLHEKVREAIREGKISATAAAVWADLPRDDQLAKLEKALAKGGRVTVRQAREVAKGGNNAWRPNGRELKVWREHLHAQASNEMVPLRDVLDFLVTGESPLALTLGRMASDALAAKKAKKAAKPADDEVPEV